MKDYELFSKRQKQLRGEVPEVYQYEDIPQKLRVQISYIWQDVWGKVYYSGNQLIGSNLAIEAYRSIETTLCREYGVFTLDEGDGFYQDVRSFFFQTEDTEKVIDVIELSFQYIDRQIRDYHDEEIPAFLPEGVSSELSCCIPPDEAIDELNHQFHEHRVGYQYESGQIIKIDSQFIHSEVIKPALIMLADPIYKGANEEYLNAHEHYRKGRYKECLNDCLKAFESCMKIICGKREWPYNEKDTANRLIETVFKHALIDSSMTCHFTALISTLKSGVPTVRNDQSAHGQGSEEIIVPEYIASYILHLTASNILLLTKADGDIK